MTTPRLCECGHCQEPATGHYRVKRGHGDRVKPAPRPGQDESRRSTRVSDGVRMTHIEDAPKPAPKPRDCLRCDRRFMSRGPAHRLCKRCRDAIELADTPAHVHPMPGRTWSGG